MVNPAARPKQAVQLLIRIERTLKQIRLRQNDADPQHWRSERDFPEAASDKFPAANERSALENIGQS